jgi:hypothetical protein
MDELEPVDGNEFVYRRIHPRFHKPDLAVPVLFEAFRPNRNDTTGLSLFRALFAQPMDCLPRDAAKSTGYLVARLLVSDLHDLGLSIHPQPDPSGPAGHAVIRELSIANYENDKVRWRPILLALAKLASKSIIFGPS